jgi:hypothetical protein
VVTLLAQVSTKPKWNSGFSQLRILLKPVADFPLENLILVENMPSRSSQLTSSCATLAVS